jgi:hypothetical protein
MAIINSNQRTNGMSQRNSFVSLAEELTAMNKNAVEIIAKTSQMVSSEDSAISITLTDSKGNTTDYYMPTVGYLKNEIDKINNNIKRLSGIDSTTTVIDNNSIKKVYTVDLNKEPYPIGELPTISKFGPTNNHFFESLMNPLLSVNLDISDKVTENINKIKARRYIVKFERNSDFSLTTDGLRSYTSFKSNFENKTNIEIGDFIDWYDTNVDIGILQDVVEPYDEQIFDLSVNEVDNHGIFSVIKTETDTINKKFWYHLNTLTYYTKDGYDKSLTIGDYLTLNKLKSATRWKILEVNTESSNNRVSLERVEGYDPIPIGTNVLSYYSNTTNKKNVNITIGFDEFCILFIKPINTENNVISTLWSKGTYFYTNDLVLETDDNTDLSEYYLRSVYDYGKVLKDMVLKKIPIEYAEKPTAVTLNSENFKVVQINKHITENENSRIIKNLHSQKVSSKSKLSQINNAITEKNKDLNTRTFSTTTEYNTVKNEISKLIDEQSSVTKTLASTVSQINTQATETNGSLKFRVRGFWNIPQPIYNGKSEAQHIVQFRVQYRYSSKTGEVNSTEGFKLRNEVNSEVGDNTGKVIADIVGGNAVTTTTTSGNILPSGTLSPILKGNLNTSISQTDDTNNGDTTAYFSNWVEVISDVRKRYWDSENGYWYWKIEDVEDADTPNINQLDISISPNEQVEIRIKSISEVGWPDSRIESDWSDILTIEFPDELDNILNENEYILKEASQDETLVSMGDMLTSKGVYKHIENSFYINETYYGHTDKGIQSSFTDDNGNYINVYEYLNLLTNRVKTLEDNISKVKGEFSVYLHTPDGVYPVKTNQSYNVIVELEDYAERSGSTRSYFNTIGMIDDYYVEIKNISTNPLSLLSNRKYEITPTNTFFQLEDHKSLIVDQSNNLYTQFDYQYIWFSDSSNGDPIYSGITSTSSAPQVLQSSDYNIGWSGETCVDFYSPVFNISDLDWLGTPGSAELFTTVHPKIQNSSDLVESGSDKIKSLKGGSSETVMMNIYYKLNGNLSQNDLFTVPISGTPNTRYRKVKFFIEPDTLSRPFEFEIRFKIKQYREILYTSSFSGGGTSIL